MTTTETVQIQMPQMGESVTEGTVLEWHKQEGDYVEEGDTVVEVSTDKVDAEVPAPANGTIAKILKGADETVQVGEALAELEPGPPAPARIPRPRSAPRPSRSRPRPSPRAATGPEPKRRLRRRDRASSW
jgi:pyruvate/2-oxoglutarate dehydrogenase complex dihydrolipoamide acyltransferase (E2) component